MDANTHAVPTDLRSGDRTIRLKWHKVKRRAEDPLFARQNIREGLAAGASIELDIRPLAWGNWLCLHDPMLERETTGAGPVADATADAVRDLRMREGGERLLFLDELVELVRASPAAPTAEVQLDFQTVDVALEEHAVAAFREVFCEGGRGFILSGYDWKKIHRLGQGVDGLALGWDPSLEAPNHPGKVLELVRDTAPEARMIYLHRMLVRASHASDDELIRRLAECGHLVDCWTVDCGRPDADLDLTAAIATGCHQLTTNTAIAWAERYASPIVDAR